MGKSNEEDRCMANRCCEGVQPHQPLGGCFRPWWAVRGQKPLSKRYGLRDFIYKAFSKWLCFRDGEQMYGCLELLMGVCRWEQTEGARSVWWRNRAASALRWWVSESTQVWKGHPAIVCTLCQCHIPSFDAALWVSQMKPLSRQGEGDRGALCTVCYCQHVDSYFRVRTAANHSSNQATKTKYERTNYFQRNGWVTIVFPPAARDAGSTWS